MKTILIAFSIVIVVLFIRGVLAAARSGRNKRSYTNYTAPGAATFIPMDGSSPTPDASTTTDQGHHGHQDFGGHHSHSHSHFDGSGGGPSYSGGFDSGGGHSHGGGFDGGSGGGGFSGGDSGGGGCGGGDGGGGGGS